MTIEKRHDRLEQRGLISFDGDHEAALLFGNLRRNFFLAAHGIDRDNRPFDIDLLQQSRDRGDFVRLFFCRDLS